MACFPSIDSATYGDRRFLSDRPGNTEGNDRARETTQQGKESPVKTSESVQQQEQHQQHQRHRTGEVLGMRRFAKVLKNMAAGTKGVVEPDMRYPPIPDHLKEQHAEAVPMLQRALNLHGAQMARYVIGTLVTGSALTYVFWDDIQRLLGRSGAEVASEIIMDKQVHQSAEELSRAVLYQLLTDEKTIQHARRFLRDLFAEPELVQALTHLLNGVLSSPSFRSQALVFFQHLFSTPELRRATGDLFYQVLQYDSTRDGVIRVLKQALNDPTVRTTIGDLFADVLKYQVVQTSAADLGSRTAHSVLNDAQVVDHSIEFVESVLHQDKVQQDAGDALYNAIYYSIIPSWLRRGKSSPPPSPPAPVPENSSEAGTKGELSPASEDGAPATQAPENHPSHETEDSTGALEGPVARVLPSDFDPLTDNRVPQ